MGKKTRKQKMSEEIEITFSEPQTFQQTIKINNFRSFISSGKEFRSKYIEIFPGKDIAFVVKPLDSMKEDPDDEYVRFKQEFFQKYLEPNDAFFEHFKIFSLEFLAARGGFEPPRLAGEVEIILLLGDTKSSTSFSFGDHQYEKYLTFDKTKRNLVIEPKITQDNRKRSASIGHMMDPSMGLVECIENDYQRNVLARLFYVVLDDGISSSSEEEDNKTPDRKDTALEIRYSLHCPGEITEEAELDLPASLESNQFASELIKKIMKDEKTADLKITCGEKENKKIFNVHKIFFCANSPVFRAAVEEGKSEIFIEEVDEKTVQEMIHYVYTGKFTGADLNVQMVAWVANKYDLPGMMDLLCFKMNDVEDENIADMLIAAGTFHNHHNNIL